MSWTAFSRRFKPVAAIVPDVGAATRAPMSFRQFVTFVKPSFIWYKHCEVLADVLQRATEGEIKRLMIFEPPRHGKSELFSRLWPAYLSYRFPQDEIGIASYSASLAITLAADARTNYRQCGGLMDRTHNAKRDWKNQYGGRMWAEGVGGSMTGKGFNWGLIDDPIKGAQQAGSEATKTVLREWYQSVFYTRQAPNAFIGIVNTRWAEDDLSGWQLEQEWTECHDTEDGATENWHIVNLRAICDLDLDAEDEFPPSCTIEPDWRMHGEALCPERYPVGKLKRLFKKIGSYFAAALYQQRPVPKGGGVFSPAWFSQRIHVSMIPPMRYLVLGVDLALSEKTSADYTVAMPVGVDHRGVYYFFRPYRDQVESPDGIKGIAAHAMSMNIRTVGIESVAYQASAIQHLQRMGEMVGRAVVPVRADKDKVTRARGWSPLAESGQIVLVVDGTGWEDVWLKEVVGFPRAAHDDQVDAPGIALELLAHVGEFSAATGGEDVKTRVKTGLASKNAAEAQNQNIV